MARVTVEDCIQNIPNRFRLVLMAAQRARDIAAGQPLMVDRDNDKNAVVSLREIAEQLVNLDELEAHIVSGVNRHSETTREDEVLAAMQSEWLSDEQIAQLEGAPIEEIGFDGTEASSADDEDGEEMEAAEGDMDEPSAEELMDVDIDIEVDLTGDDSDDQKAVG